METINLPDSTLERCYRPIKERYTPFLNDGFAFVLSRINQTQLAYSLFEGLEDFHEKNPTSEVCIYSMNNELTIGNPQTSIFPASSLGEHIGAVIATCPLTWNLVNSAYADITRFYYVYDPMLLRLMPPQQVQAIAASDFTFIFRTVDHANFSSQVLPQAKFARHYAPHAELEIFNTIVKESLNG